MNAFVLKIIACITMFIDHISYVIPESTQYIDYIGRFAFPIFAFQISEGYIHTRNVKKYVFRLILFALISQIPFMLFYKLIDPNKFELNVIFTLLFGLLSIIIYDKYNKYVGIISAFYLGLIAKILNFDYGFYGVAIVLLFYVSRNNKILLSFSFLTATLIYYFIRIFEYYPYGVQILIEIFNASLPYVIFTMLAIIPILLYNKKKGPDTKYLLYLFYPLHMLLIYLISYMI